MKKISFVTQNIAPFRINWLDELAKYYEVTIFHNGEYVGEVNRDYVDCKPGRASVTLIKKKIFLTIFGYDFRKIFDNHADWIILDGYGFKSQMFLIFKLRHKKIPYILNIDGGFVKKENKLKSILKRALISGAAGYLSTSEATDKFLEFYGAEKSKIARHYLTSLYNSDIRFQQSDKFEKILLRDELGIDVNKTIIVSIGKFIPIKGFDVLLNAMRYVDNDKHLILIGGEPTDCFNDIIKSNSLNNVSFVNFVNKDMVFKYLDAADLFVFPSRGDVWGLVINEAMARGLPIIASDQCIAAVSLVVNNENGFIVPVDNEKALANKINLLSEDKELRSIFGKNSIEKIKAYSIENIVKMDCKTLEHYYN